MIEFFMSKVWAMIFSMALVSTILVSFQTLDIESEREILEGDMEKLTNTIEEMVDFESGTAFSLSMKEFISNGEEMRITNSTIQLIGEHSSLISTIYVPIGMIRESGKIETDFSMLLWQHSRIHLEVLSNDFLVIHLSKSSDILLDRQIALTYMNTQTLQNAKC